MYVNLWRNRGGLMTLIVKIKKVMSFGRLAGKDYMLVCRGAPIGKNKILIKSKFLFCESLISNTPLDWRPVTNDIPLSPLSVRSSISAEVKFRHGTWQIKMNIDLINWKFSISALNQQDLPLTKEIAYLLLASFGIQNENAAMSFATISSLDEGKPRKRTQ